MENEQVENDMLHDFDAESIVQEFQISEQDLEGVNLLFGYYEYGNYEGDAFVLFEQDGKLFEVNAGHCSCYGLEGRWEPEQTSVAALLQRPTRYFHDDLLVVLADLEARGVGAPFQPIVLH